MTVSRNPKTGLWDVRIEGGRHPDGRRRQLYRRGFKTKRAGEEFEARTSVALTDRTYVARSRQSLGAFLVDDWLPAARVELQPSTWESYARNLRLHVVPTLGAVPLQALDPSHLNRLYADLLADGRRDGRPGGLSARTVRYLHAILSGALGDAVEWGRIAQSPAKRAKPPSAKQARGPEMQTWPAETLERFLDLESDTRYGPAWYFLATTGARRGEALGLRWSDLDLDEASAAVRQTVTAVRHQVVIAPRTKTGRSRRIDLDERTVAVLRAWRARQLEERLAVGAGYTDHGLVFCLPDGRPYNPDRFSREFDRRVARHALPRIRLHDLRHTWATLALEAGVDVRVVAERLGNSPAVVWKNYQHVRRALSSGAAEAVAARIFGGAQP